jgi:hypothetical protein
MNWSEQITSRKLYLSPLAHKLAVIIDQHFAASSVCTARFYDSQAGAILDTSSSAIRHARHELMREGLLVQMQGCSGKPVYSLRRGSPAYADDSEVA